MSDTESALTIDLVPAADIDPDAVAALVNSAFAGAYAIGLLVFGWLVDRYGTKIGYALSIALWSTAAVSHALVGSVGGFFAARIFLGVSEGGNFPSAIKAVALWFPRRERALATAIFNSGTNVGALIAPLAIPAVALTLGWRWAFYLVVPPGLLLGVWCFLMREPRRGQADEGAAEAPQGGRRRLRLRANPRRHSPVSFWAHRRFSVSDRDGG